MTFKNIFTPMLYLMNKLSFKLKMLVSASVFALLLIAPSYQYVINFFEKDRLYTNQIIGANYCRNFQNIIEKIQVHRGLTNGYMNGASQFKDKILNNEKEIFSELAKIKSFDTKNINFFDKHREFQIVFNEIDNLKLQNITVKQSKNEIFEIHNSVILKLIHILKQTTTVLLLNAGTATDVNYFAHMIEERLLLLQEYSAQFRGYATGIFAIGSVKRHNKEDLLNLITLINTNRATLVDNRIDKYHKLTAMIQSIDYQIDTLISIVNKEILLNDSPSYPSNIFFSQATNTIRNQTDLYDMFIQKYTEIIEEKKNSLHKQYTVTLTLFILIILASLYIAGLFYYSVTDNLNKLKEATKLIARGETNIKIQVNGRDEIAAAILAFNKMSHNLGKNLAFLDGYKLAIDETSIVSKTDKKGVITYVNQLFCDISGYSKEELLGYSHRKIKHPESKRAIFIDMWRTIQEKKVWKGVIKNRKKDGSHYIVDATILPILDSNGEIYEYVAVRHDITELENSKSELKQQKRDLLTGLPNRNQLLEDIQKSFYPTVFYININSFASLNEFYGSKFGDMTLIFIATLLSNIQDKYKMKVYKLTADEFILLFENNEIDKNNYQTKFNEIIERIEKETLECVSNNCVSVILSGSVVLGKEDRMDKDFLTHTTIARKRAIQENKKFLLYSQTMENKDDYAKNIEWINKIKEAIKEDRITTFFQPIVENKTGKITKFEALVRLIEKDGTVISPFFFLEIAKKAKLYKTITHIVIEKSFAMFEKRAEFSFSLNLTIEDIHDEETCNYLFKKLENFPHSQNVVLEITENEQIEDYTTINEFITKAKQYGAKISIDDFGSGYANFDHIISLKADYIKIDATLIKDIVTDNNAKIITESIIEFSKKLGSKTVVEFVHNEDVLQEVIKLGADYSQGFHLGVPNPYLETKTLNS